MRIGAKHYWRRRVREKRPGRPAAAACDPSGTIAKLSPQVLPELSWFSRFIVALEAFAIGATVADLSSPRYVRLEVEPDTKAHEVCAGQQVTAGMELSFGGAIVVDTDGPFLEVHPEDDFRIEIAT